MWEGFGKKEDCRACEVYKEQLDEFKRLLAAERSERQLLEDRLLRHLRVIPSDGDAQIAVGPDRVARRIDWPAIRAEEEKKLKDAAPEIKERRLYWEKKAKEVEIESPVVNVEAFKEG